MAGFGVKFPEMVSTAEAGFRVRLTEVEDDGRVTDQGDLRLGGVPDDDRLYKRDGMETGGGFKGVGDGVDADKSRVDHADFVEVVLGQLRAILVEDSDGGLGVGRAGFMDDLRPRAELDNRGIGIGDDGDFPGGKSEIPGGVAGGIEEGAPLACRGRATDNQDSKRWYFEAR